MTKEEFEAEYSKQCDVPIDKLHSMGMGAEPCDCGLEYCRGWQIVFRPENMHEPPFPPIPKEEVDYPSYFLDPEQLADMVDTDLQFQREKLSEKKEEQ